MARNTAKGIRRVAYCPHCGNTAPQRLITRQPYFERAWTVGGPPDEKADLAPWSSFVASCETCHQILVYDNPGDSFDAVEFTSGTLVYPKHDTLSKSVPEIIVKVYSEAVRIKQISPNAFAGQIRRALEALCKDRSAPGRTLQESLKHLADSGEIPPRLAEVSSLLRILGNMGVHAGTESVHPLHVNAIDEFFRAIVEYIYIAPAKLKQFEASLKLAPKGAPTRSKNK